MTCVAGSSIKYSKKSQSSRSAWLPTETHELNPAPISKPRMSIDPIKAPLWLTSPMLPDGRCVMVPSATDGDSAAR